MAGRNLAPLDLQMRMPVLPGSMVVLFFNKLGRYQAEREVAHAALRRHAVGQRPHRAGRAAQHRHFQAGIMVQVHMHRGHGQVMSGVLRLGDALGQVAGVVVVHVAQRGDAGRLGLRGPVAGQGLAQQVAHRLRPAGIAAGGDAGIHRGQQVVLQRDGHPFHAARSVSAEPACWPDAGVTRLV